MKPKIIILNKDFSNLWFSGYKINPLSLRGVMRRGNLVF
jgi:hypothetical protein